MHDPRIALVNAHMIGTSTEPGEHVEWDEPDIDSRSAWENLLGTSVEEYAADNPHMIVFEVDPAPAVRDDERGSISGDIAASIMAAVVLVFLALLLVAWWAPEAHATRPIPGAGPRADMCQNVRGVQTVEDVLRRTGDYRVTHVVVSTRTGRTVARICREVRR